MRVELETVRRRATVAGFEAAFLSSAASEEAARDTGGDADEGGTARTWTCASESSVWTAREGEPEEAGDAADGERSETT